MDGFAKLTTKISAKNSPALISACATLAVLYDGEAHPSYIMGDKVCITITSFLNTGISAFLQVLQSIVHNVIEYDIVVQCGNFTVFKMSKYY